MCSTLEGWQKNSHKAKTKNIFGYYRLCNGLNISTCKLDAKDIPDAFKHIRDMFSREPGPEIKVSGPGAGTPFRGLRPISFHY